MAEQTEFFAPIGLISKGAASADGNESRIVTGIVSGSSVDIDLQNADPEWLKGALAEWWDWRNIQANHNGPDVGVGIELSKSADDDDWNLVSEVVDPLAITKLDKGVYKGYSIGIRWPKLAFKSASAPGGTIVGGKIVHVALCGRPALDKARISVLKAPSADSYVLAKSVFADIEAETPEQAEELAKAARSGITVAADGSHQPFDGSHTHAHDAFGSQGDDKTHEHDHVHHNDADHDHHESAGAKSAQSELNKAVPSEKEGGNKTPPKGYPEDDSDYADPTNHKYPLDTPGRITSAIAYFNKNAGENREKGDYSVAEWKTMGGRMVAAANKRFDGGYSLSGTTIVTPSTKRSSSKDAGASDEMTDSQLAQQAIDIVKQLIAREAAESSGDDDDDDIFDVYQLAGVLDGLRYFQSGEMNEAMLMAVGKEALATLWKSGARNSTADMARIQAIHDQAGELGASASDGCKANAGDGEDMDEKTARAIVADELGTALPKALEAAGVAPDLFKSAVAKDEVAELLKGAVTPLEERLTAIENRPEDNGPLIMAVQRGLVASQAQSHKAALAQEADELWARAQSHQDPRVRADAVLRYSKIRAELEQAKD